MVSSVSSNFVKQQGFADMPAESCGVHFGALNFQPRVIAPLVVVAMVLQSAPLFLALGAVSWFSALFPRWNPFDAVYNATLGGRQGRPRLGVAPPPRRFSMGMAGTFMLGIGLSLNAGAMVWAIVLQVFLGVALVALVVGRFCLGSYVFHLLRGRAAYANRTLPWSRG